jgi:AcrR family transcriptional regulator
MRKGQYHHGDLRRALLNAAERVVIRDGPAQVSIRAIAREAGVSHAAPYHHFADREALLAAVAGTGFDRLRSVMQVAAGAGGPDDPLSRLQAAGIAYVRFAVANPEIYRLMFSGLLADRSRYPDLEASTEAAFGVLLALLGDQGRAKGQGARPDANTLTAVATATWSLVHGLAFLLIEGLLADEVASYGSDEIARQVTRVLGVGLRSVV